MIESKKTFTVNGEEYPYYISFETGIIDKIWEDYYDRYIFEQRRDKRNEKIDKLLGQLKTFN